MYPSDYEYDDEGKLPLFYRILFLMFKGQLLYMEPSHDMSYNCDEEDGVLNVEWRLREPYNTYSLLESGRFGSELESILTYTVPTVGYPYGELYDTMSGAQAAHLHISLTNFQFANEEQQWRFLRFLNKVWVEEYQDDVSERLNPMIDQWHQEDFGTRNLNAWYEDPQDDRNYPKLRGDRRERYVLLNLLPSHPRYNPDGYKYPLHVEYRGLKPPLKIGLDNEWTFDAREYQGYLVDAANTLMGILGDVLARFFYDVDPSRGEFRVGLEIETCFDVQKLSRLDTVDDDIRTKFLAAVETLKRKEEEELSEDEYEAWLNSLKSVPVPGSSDTLYDVHNWYMITLHSDVYT